MTTLIQLFLSFVKIGALSFGGGYVMIPFIQTEIVNLHKWIKVNELLDVIGVSQMTPGPIAINAATFVGFRVSGVWGSVVATVGVTIVSFILVLIVSKVLDKVKESTVVKAGLLGMRPILIALIIKAFIDLAKESYVDIKSIIITIIIGGLLLSKKVHPILVIVIAAILGIVFYMY